MVRFQSKWPRQPPSPRPQNITHVSMKIGKLSMQIKIENDVDQDMTQPRVTRVITTIRRRIGINVFGRNARPNENKLILEIGSMQNSATHRIEERLRAFGL